MDTPWFFIESKGSKGEYFQLTVLDITDKEIKHVLSDENIGSSSLQSTFVFNKCSLEGVKFDEGDEVEVFLSERSSWWPAKLKQIKDQFCVCELISDSSKEVVDISQLRPRNYSQPLAEVKFVRCTVTNDIEDADAEFLMSDLMSRLTGPCLPLPMAEPPCVLSLCAQDATRAALIGEALHKKARLKLQLMRSISDMEQKLQQLETAGASHVTEEFSIERQLIGLALGARGSNVKRARSLPGVIRVHFHDASASFTVVAETQEACTAARQMLELQEQAVWVPASAVGRLVGRQGHNMQQLIDKCHVINVEIGEAGADQLVPVYITGSKAAVNDAKFVIEYQIEAAREEASVEDEEPLDG